MRSAQSMNKGYDTLTTRSPSCAATRADLYAGKSAKPKVGLPAPRREASSLKADVRGLGRGGTLTVGEHLALSTVGVGI